MVDEDRLFRADQITSGVNEFVAVVEFVQGCALQGIDGQAALRDGETASILEALGSLIALDCLLNNLDRVPAIWLNDGNLSNIMVADRTRVVGIDQQVNAIRDAAGRDRYFEAL